MSLENEIQICSKCGNPCIIFQTSDAIDATIMCINPACIKNGEALTFRDFPLNDIEINIEVIL